jgi:lysophospholipase L1-like esterase
MVPNERIAHFALVVLGTSLGLASGEVLARVTYVPPWHERLLDAQVPVTPNDSILHNSWGLRGPGYETPKSPGTKRILLLGDSFTFGAGVADDAAVFPAIIEQRLNARYQQSGTRFEILNGGIPGSRTTAWVNLLNEVKDAFEPDVIVSVFFLRDGTLARDRNLIATRYAQAINESYLGNASQTEEWSVAQANLLEIQRIGSSLGATVALVVFPILVDLGDDYPFREVCDLLVQFGNANDLPTLDLLPAFLGREASELWVAPQDQHPNAAGHLIAADALMPFFEMLLIP